MKISLVFQEKTGCEMIIYILSVDVYNVLKRRNKKTCQKDKYNKMARNASGKNQRKKEESI